MSELVSIPIKRKEDCQDIPLPKYQSEGSSGVDLYAAIDLEEDIMPLEIKKIPTGIFLEIPRGYEAQIRPRSGLAFKYGISMVNSPGTIDSDYRGEIAVLLVNLSKEKFSIKRGDRIAQMIFAPIARVTWEENNQLSITSRGAGGFGSTGF